MASAILRFGRFGRRTVSRLKCLGSERLPSSLERDFHLHCSCQGTFKIAMPALSPTMTEGTIVKWLKKEGDAVSPGDVLCDIQTDKAVVSMDIEEEGILAKILKPDDSQSVKVGSLIALMVDEGDDWQNVEIPAEMEATTTDESPAVAASSPTPTSAAPVEHRAGDTSHSIGPSVRKLLEEYGISSSDVLPSGPHSRIVKGDVLNYIKSKNLKKVELKADAAPASKPAQAQVKAAPSTLPPLEGEAFIDIPNTSMRKTIAKRLTESKTTIPHSYATADCSVGAVMHLRKKLVEEGIKVSVNDFIIKAAGIALQRVPQVNSIWQGESAQLVSTVDISVAVATDSGLITPIVKSAAIIGVDEISKIVRDLASRAREGKLQLREFQGGSFCISNLGMYGISEFSAVINPPQTAILAIGTSRLVLGEDGTPDMRMSVTLSYDSRVIDETEASQFLEVYCDTMETPNFMLAGTKLATKARTAV